MTYEVPDSFEEVVVETHENGDQVLGTGDIVSDNGFVSDDDTVLLIPEQSESNDEYESEAIPYSGPVLYSVNESDLSSHELYEVILSSDPENTYFLLFPDSADLFITDDGYLVNFGASSVSAPVLTGEVLDLSSYKSQYVTLNSFTSSSANNNAYRYGSYSYVTTYTPSTGNSLSSDSEYIQIQVVNAPKLGSSFETTDFLLFGGFALMILFYIAGTIFRKR